MADEIEKNWYQIGKAIKQEKAMAALEIMQINSILNGSSEISDTEIEKEINAVRKARKKH
jgi:hypothetical protein